MRIVRFRKTRKHVNQGRTQKFSTTLTSLQYLLKFAPMLDKLKSFQWTRNSGTDFIVHRSIAALKVFKENISTNLGLIAVFVNIAFEITKWAPQHCVLPWLTFFCFRKLCKFTCVELAVECVRSFTKKYEWYKLFGNTQKVANLSALRWVVPIYICVGYVFDSRFSEWKIQPISEAYLLKLGKTLSRDFEVIFIFRKNEVLNVCRYLKRFYTYKKINKIFLKFYHYLFRMQKIVEIGWIFHSQ